MNHERERGQVRRWDFVEYEYDDGAEMVLEAEGDYVLHTDYAAIESRALAAEARIREAD